MYPIKKTIYTLVVNDYAPRIRELTFPLMKHYADKIGANFHVITERKFPDWPITYEKLQIFELASQSGDDWNIFFDADTLVNPEMFDITTQLPLDTVAHNGKDFANIRWRYDQYFLRDGRSLGSCNWCTIASDWCLDLWRPLDDLTLDQALSNIFITNGEHNSGNCLRDHLIDDYTLSRNIARFGLKATTLCDICERLGYRTPDGKGVNPFLWHKYTLTEEQKLQEMLAVLSTPSNQMIKDATTGQPIGIGWGLMPPDQAVEIRRKWGMA